MGKFMRFSKLTLDIYKSPTEIVQKYFERFLKKTQRLKWEYQELLFKISPKNVRCQNFLKKP